MQTALSEIQVEYCLQTVVAVDIDDYNCIESEKDVRFNFRYSFFTVEKVNCESSFLSCTNMQDYTNTKHQQMNNYKDKCRFARLLLL